MKRILVLIALVLGAFAQSHARIPARNPEGKYIPRGWLMPPLDSHDSTHAYDVRCYRIDLTLPMNNSSFQAHERVTVASRLTGLDTVTLHMNSLVCDSVKIAGARTTFTTPSGLLMVNLDRAYNPGESLDLEIYYHRNSGGQLRGFYWYSRAQSGYHVVAYSTTEPSDARYWFPGFDEPWDKAEQGCQINVTVPDSLSACANGLLDSVTANSTAHTKTYWWSEHYPIATYLMVFAASRWSVTKQWFPTSPTESLYIQNFVWPEDSVEAISAFAHNVDMMNFYSDSNRYGAYPFEKYGMVEAYPFQWGGMENQTMTMIHNYWVTSGSDNGIAHEMSHQWWGDMVTCLDWRNIWLNEGFATYSDELYDYHQHGRGSFRSLIAGRAQDYFDEEAGDLHPIYNPPYPNHLFDWGHSYCKGAWVQHMLRYVEGDTVFLSPGIFFRALRAYGDSFKYGGATTDDYRRIHERMTGLDLGWFFNEWVYMAGYPQYTINWHAVHPGPDYQVLMDIGQSNGAQAPSCFHMPLQITIRMPGKDTIVTVPIASNPQSAAFNVSGNPSALVADPDTWLLKKALFYVGIENATAGELAQPLAAHPSVLHNSTSIRYTGELAHPGADRSGRAGHVSLGIFDAGGREVRTLVSGPGQPGTHYADWDGRDTHGKQVAPGVFFCRLVAAGVAQQVKLVVTQ
jgi:aminopeptidase N